MIVPCIDLMDGKVVQLVQGREKALEGDAPLAMLERFSAPGTWEFFFASSVAHHRRDFASAHPSRSSIWCSSFPVHIPVIASGGAGLPEHFVRVLTEGKADAALAASVFHYGTYTVVDLKNELVKAQVPVRPPQ